MIFQLYKNFRNFGIVWSINPLYSNKLHRSRIVDIFVLWAPTHIRDDAVCLRLVPIDLQLQLLLRSNLADYQFNWYLHVLIYLQFKHTYKYRTQRILNVETDSFVKLMLPYYHSVRKQFFFAYNLPNRKVE